MPQTETERLKSVQRFLNLEVNKKEELQEIVELAAELCETPVGLITLVDEDAHYFKFQAGLGIDENLSEETFCKFIADGDDLLVIDDTLEDSRFLNNPDVAGDPHVRFFACVALRTHDGHKLGNLCVLDLKPKHLLDSQKHLLKVLAKRILQIVEFNLSLQIIKKQFLQSEFKLRSFFESAGVCHLLIGKDQEVIAFNKTMADFLERMYHVHLYAGIKISQVFKTRYLDNFIVEYKVALSGIPVKYERAVRYEHETIWWFATFEPGYNPEGEIIGVSYNAIDITERKRHEKQIIAQNAALREIARIQSHEMRRPVASILGLMEVFKMNQYKATKNELIMLEKAAKELDSKIRTIVNFTDY